MMYSSINMYESAILLNFNAITHVMTNPQREINTLENKKDEWTSAVLILHVASWKQSTPDCGCPTASTYVVQIIPNSFFYHQGFVVF